MLAQFQQDRQLNSHNIGKSNEYRRAVNFFTGQIVGAELQDQIQQNNTRKVINHVAEKLHERSMMQAAQEREEAQMAQEMMRKQAVKRDLISHFKSHSRVATNAPDQEDYRRQMADVLKNQMKERRRSQLNKQRN